MQQASQGHSSERPGRSPWEPGDATAKAGTGFSSEGCDGDGGGGEAWATHGFKVLPGHRDRRPWWRPLTAPWNRVCVCLLRRRDCLVRAPQMTDRASLSWIHTFQALNAGFIRFFLGEVGYRHRQALSLGKQAQRCEVICLHHVRAPLRPTLCSEDPALGHV